MIYVSDVMSKPPQKFKTTLQKIVYKTLEELEIPFYRVYNDEAITMEDCNAIDEKLGVDIVKTLFLCNRQETEFYLYVMPGDKKFVCKDFGKSLNISRVSFASEEKMKEMAGTYIGCATILSVLYDTDLKINIVIDKSVLTTEYFGCSDGDTTGYLKIKTKDLLDKILPYSKHEFKIIEI